MTKSALVMLLVTWTVVAYFTVGFFVQVVRTPPRSEE